jgi:hypothetical protein
MRERDIKWKDIAYVVDMTESAAQMALKRKRDIENPVIKRSKFETPIHLRVKHLARDNPKLAIRDFEALLRAEFPDKDIPKKSTIHKILNEDLVENLANSANKRINKVLNLKGKVSKYFFIFLPIEPPRLVLFKS